MAGIVIDIDGVVANSERFIVKHLEESSGKKLHFTNPRTFQFNIDIPLWQMIWLIDESIILYKNDIPVHDEGFTTTALLMLEEKFGEVNFLSARSQSHDVVEATEWWLQNNFSFVKYNLYNLGDSGSKYQWMLENGFDAIVEDRFKTANECNFGDNKTFLINREWNMNRQELPHVKRVDSLFEAVVKYIYPNNREIIKHFDRKECSCDMFQDFV